MKTIPMVPGDGKEFSRHGGRKNVRCRAKKLISDPNYPAPHIINSVAEALARVRRPISQKELLTPERAFLSLSPKEGILFLSWLGQLKAASPARRN